MLDRVEPFFNCVPGSDGKIFLAARVRSAGQVVYQRGPKVFIARDEKGFLCLSARCTHLGCMVVWNRDHRMFLCPCHGGKFNADGRNVEGPPPRPLDLLALRIDENGFLVVDQDIIIKRGKGPAPRFRPEAG